MTPIWHPSPNFGPRRDGLHPELIVIHYTAMNSAQAALERLCDPEAEVSAHYLIGVDGTVWSMVAEDVRAWHAGTGSWKGRGDVNSRSIGIELDNRGDHPFPNPQMVALEDLLSDVMARWGIHPQGVIGHSDMAPERKQDPGPRFDWQRLERQRLARPRGTGARPGGALCPQFRELAREVGYPEEIDDTILLNAIRSRYRPWAKGPLTLDDLVVLETPSLGT